MRVFFVLFVCVYVHLSVFVCECIVCVCVRVCVYLRPFVGYVYIPVSLSVVECVMVRMYQFVSMRSCKKTLEQEPYPWNQEFPAKCA